MRKNWIIWMAIVSATACQTTQPVSPTSQASSLQSAPATDRQALRRLAAKDLPEGQAVDSQASKVDPTSGDFADDVVLCKTYKTTGSRLARRKVCKTRQEWRLEQLEAQREMNNQKDSNTGFDENAEGAR